MSIVDIIGMMPWRTLASDWLIRFLIGCPPLTVMSVSLRGKRPDVPHVLSARL